MSLEAIAILALFGFSGLLLYMDSRTPLQVAQSQIGVTSVGGRFRGPPMLYALPKEEPLAWCARFLRWCWIQCGKRLPGNPYLIGSVAELQAACADAGFFFGPDGDPQPGDVMFLRGVGTGDDGIEFGGHHVCIVEYVDADGVHSIDGDYGVPDRVLRLVRPRTQADIWGYARVA